MRPVVGNYAEGLYAGVLPIAVADNDEAQGWALLRFCGLLGAMHELVDSIVTTSDLGPGWSSLMDLDRTSAEFLDWLAQFNGVTTTQGFTPEQKRVEVREAKGFRRGKPAAMVSAAQLFLTGTKTVRLLERFDGNAYHIRMLTRTDETPDPAALVAYVGGPQVKPAGLIFSHDTYVGWLIEDMEAAYAGQTITDLEGDFADITHLEENDPI